MYSFWVRTVGLSKYICNVILFYSIFISDIYFYYVLEEIWVASTIMVLTRPDQSDPQKKRHLKSSFELFMGFWVYQWPTQWLRLGRLVGDARFVNEWKIETAEPTKTRVLEVVGCFSVMFVWEGWWNTTRVFWSKLDFMKIFSVISAVPA